MTLTLTMPVGGRIVEPPARLVVVSDAHSRSDLAAGTGPARPGSIWAIVRAGRRDPVALVCRSDRPPSQAQDGRSTFRLSCDGILPLEPPLSRTPACPTSILARSGTACRPRAPRREEAMRRWSDPDATVSLRPVMTPGPGGRTLVDGVGRGGLVPRFSGCPGATGREP
jgi:hypothetical protein